MAEVISVNISEKRGTVKREVPEIQLKLRHGIVGDAHAGDWHRQISLLAEESVDKMRSLLPDLPPGAFAENINTRGIELKALPIGTRLRLGETVVEVTQIGKECHNDCEIKRRTGKCVMPTEGIFAVVVREGTVRKGDKIEIIKDSIQEVNAMKRIPTQEAVGHVLCHDMTQIIPGQYKGARFRKGHVVREEDIPVLLSMGKEHLYVWELVPGMVHENDAAERLCALCRNAGMDRSAVKEGKIELTAAEGGLFQVDSQRLNAVNALEDVMIATRHGGAVVRRGDKLAGMRVIPLVIEEEKLRRAEEAAGNAPLLELLPWKLKTAAILATGGEVAKGLIQDAFTPVVEKKLAEFGIQTVERRTPGDDIETVKNAILEVKAARPDLILCTGGMSVDPDDNTPGAIKRSGARIVTYGAPVLPGAMFLLGYFEDGTPICGLPGCVMYAGRTIFDLLLPKIAAGVPVTRADITVLGEGGLCLGCEVCTYPNCGFGK